MSTRLAPLAGAAVGLLLAFFVVLGMALDLPLLTATAAALLGAAILAVQVDSWRRVREQRTFLRDEIRRAADQGPAPAATPTFPVAQPEDVLGAVRLLQAQYTGRLDRMQRTLEDALDGVAGDRAPRSGTGHAADGDPAGR